MKHKYQIKWFHIRYLETDKQEEKVKESYHLEKGDRQEMKLDSKLL